MTADTYRRRGAEHTPLFAALNRQWEVTAGSRQLRQRLEGGRSNIRFLSIIRTASR